MVRSFRTLRGLAIRATDGHFGKVSDVYFDDSTWRFRYCVVDSGQWFADHALIGSRNLSVLDVARRELWVRLSKAEVKRSPRAESDRPVSKQNRAGVMTSIRGLQRRISPARLKSATISPDRHLRSCNALIGHRLDATDGKAGHVDDFLIDDKTWVVRELIVDTRHGSLPAEARVLVAAQRVGGISWPNSSISSI